MKSDQFDIFVRDAASSTSRRRLGGKFLAMAIGAGAPSLLGAAASQAKRRKSRKRNKKCKPRCQGRECGGDGCGGSCGQCPTGHVCVKPDGICSSLCGVCPGGLTCDENGQCV